MRGERKTRDRRSFKSKVSLSKFLGSYIEKQTDIGTDGPWADDSSTALLSKNGVDSSPSSTLHQSHEANVQSMLVSYSSYISSSHLELLN